MGKCVLCGDYMPPWFIEEKTDKCFFCERAMGTSNDNDTIVLNEDTYDKKTVKEEYKIYLARLVERNSDEIAKKLTKGM